MTDATGPAAPAGRFSPSDAVFSAFAYWQARPGRFFALFALYVIVSAMIAAPAAVAMWRDLGEGVYPFGQAARFRLSGALLSLYSLLQFPLGAVFLAALLRVMLPRDLRPSFAHDAFMVLVVQIVVAMLAAVIAFLAILLGFGVVALVAVAAGAGAGEGAPPSPAFAAALGVAPLVLIAIVFIPMIYLMLRLSIAPALTVSEGRLRVFRSWPVTRGAALALFAAHLLRLVLVFVIWVVVAAVLGVAGLLALGVEALAGAFAAFQTFEAPPPRVSRMIAIFGPLYWLATAGLEFLSLAMGASIGASFLHSRGRVEPGAVSG